MNPDLKDRIQRAEEDLKDAEESWRALVSACETARLRSSDAKDLLLSKQKELIALYEERAKP